MAGEFGAYINEKRRGRGPDGQDIMLKDIATALGVTPTYLSDIVKGRRNPPEIEALKKLAVILPKHFPEMCLFLRGDQSCS